MSSTNSTRVQHKAGHLSEVVSSAVAEGARQHRASARPFQCWGALAARAGPDHCDGSKTSFSIGKTNSTLSHADWTC